MYIYGLFTPIVDYFPIYIQFFAENMALEATNYIRYCFLYCALVDFKSKLCTLSSSILRLTSIVTELCVSCIAFSQKATLVVREFIYLFFLFVN